MVTAGIAGIIGAGVGSLVGGGISFVTSYVRGRTDASQRAIDRQYNTDARDADRRQDRIERAYLTLQIYINRWGRLAEFWRRQFPLATESEPQVPEFSEDAEAVAQLFTSQTVVEALEEFNRHRLAFQTALMVHRAGNGNAPGTYDRVVETAGPVYDSAEEVHQLLRMELGVAE